MKHPRVLSIHAVALVIIAVTLGVRPLQGREIPSLSALDESAVSPSSTSHPGQLGMAEVEGSGSLRPMGPGSNPRPAPNSSFKLEKGIVLRLTVDSSLKVSSLGPGDTFEGEFTRPIFRQDREVVPAGSRLLIVVDRVEKRKQPHQSIFTRVGNLLMQPYEWKREYLLSFHSASLRLPTGVLVPLEVSFVRMTKPLRVNLGNPGPRTIDPPSKEGQTIREVGQQGELGKSDEDRQRNRDFILVVRLERQAEIPAPAVVALSYPVITPEPALAKGPITLAAGTHARLVLLQRLSASRNRPGDTFEARLVEPVLIGSKAVLPEGSLFEGHLVNRVPSRPAVSAGRAPCP